MRQYALTCEDELMEKKDKVAITISVVALLTSIGNIAFTVAKDFRDTTERFNCDVRRVMAEYDTFLTPAFGSALIGVQWQGLLSNVGSVPIAIVRYQLEKSDRGGNMVYTGMDQGLFDQNGSQLRLPVNIAPGQSISFRLRTGILIPPEVYTNMPKVSDPKKPLKMKSLWLPLGRKGLDFWGNSVRVVEYGKDDFKYEGPTLSDSLADPSFVMTFLTARKSIASTEFSYYGIFGSHLHDQAAMTARNQDN